MGGQGRKEGRRKRRGDDDHQRWIVKSRPSFLTWETRKWLMLKSSASCSMGRSFSTEPSYHLHDDSGRSDPSACYYRRKVLVGVCRRGE